MPSATVRSEQGPKTQLATSESRRWLGPGWWWWAWVRGRPGKKIQHLEMRSAGRLSSSLNLVPADTSILSSVEIGERWGTWGKRLA